MRELSIVSHVCRFCRFLIYNSVRFIYISVTPLFTPSFSLTTLPQSPLPFLPCRSCQMWQSIDFKRFFLAKTLAKTCHQCHQNGKSLILKEFLFVKCVMSLLYKYLSRIVITSYPLLLICCSSAACILIQQHYYIRQCNATI